MDQNTLMAKIRKLLAKAEGTDNEAEAAAFFAKAEELMIRNDIDRSQLKPEERAQIELVKITINPSGPDRCLWNNVALTRHVKFFRYSGTKLGGLVGFPADIEYVQSVVTSLILQRERFLRQDVKAGERPSWESPRSWNQSFRLGFASRIYQRLMAAQATTVKETSTGGKSTDLVLVDKKAQVTAWVRTHVGGIRRGPKISDRSLSGGRAGSAAGSRASLAGGMGAVRHDSGRALAGAR